MGEIRKGFNDHTIKDYVPETLCVYVFHLIFMNNICSRIIIPSFTYEGTKD